MVYFSTMTENIFLVFGIIFLVIFGFVGYNYMNPEDDWHFCERNRPAWNNTGERDDICFNEYWERYCYLRAPNQCPSYLNNSVPIDNLIYSNITLNISKILS